MSGLWMCCIRDPAWQRFSSLSGHSCLELRSGWHNYPARACASRGYVIGSGVHIYMFVDEKNILIVL